MPIVHTENGRFRFSVYLAGQRFVVERYATLDRTEDHPDGKVVEFVVSDNSDESKMTIDEEDAEQLERCLVMFLSGQLANEDLEAHLANVFDVVCPPPPMTGTH